MRRKKIMSRSWTSSSQRKRRLASKPKATRCRCKTGKKSTEMTVSGNCLFCHKGSAISVSTFKLYETTARQWNEARVVENSNHQTVCHVATNKTFSTLKLTFQVETKDAGSHTRSESDYHFDLPEGDVKKIIETGNEHNKFTDLSETNPWQEKKQL